MKNFAKKTVWTLIKYFHVLVLLLLSNCLFSQSIKILAAGDVNLGHWVTPIVKKHGYNYPFKNLPDSLLKSDLFFVNLEAPFTKNGLAADKKFTFKSPPELVQVLNTANINMVSLANNHIMDFGKSGLLSTMEILSSKNIKYAGAGLNKNQAQRVSKINLNNQKIAFMSFSMTLPKRFWATDTSAGTAYPFLKMMTDSITFYKQSGYLPVISFHWGKELAELPEEYQVNYAHWAVNAGAALIFGHHPHVLQGVERYKNALIFYSLGNFIFASYSEKTPYSMIVNLHVSDGEIKNAEIIPIIVNNYNVKFAPRPAEEKERELVLRKINEISFALNQQKDIVNLTTGKVE